MTMSPMAARDLASARFALLGASRTMRIAEFEVDTAVSMAEEATRIGCGDGAVARAWRLADEARIVHRESIEEYRRATEAFYAIANGNAQ